MTRLSERLRRLAHPRSRRSQLWACVYCGAVDPEAAGEPDRPEYTRR